VPQSWTLVEGSAKVSPTFRQRREHAYVNAPAGSRQGPPHTIGAVRGRGRQGGVEVIARVINCECGYVARGDSDDEVLADIEAHLRTDHPELVGQVSRQDELGWIQIEP
jgi:hypothetical protein